MRKSDSASSAELFANSIEERESRAALVSSGGNVIIAGVAPLRGHASACASLRQ